MNNEFNMAGNAPVARIVGHWGLPAILHANYKIHEMVLAVAWITSVVQEKSTIRFTFMYNLDLMFVNFQIL